MDNNGERFLANLSEETANSNVSSCPSTEDISELLDGNMSDESSDDLKKHIASCKECSEIYNLALELTGKSVKKRLSIFSISSIAASVLIIGTSFFIFYKGDNLTDKKTNSVREIVAPAPEIKVLTKEKILPKKEMKGSDKGSSELSVARSIVSEESEEPVPSDFPVKESFVDSDRIEGIKKRRMKTAFLRKSVKPQTIILPEVVKVVQPEDPTLLKNITVNNNVKLKILIDSNGKVKEITVLSEEEKWLPIVIDTVKRWKFKVSGSSVMLFELDLKINSNGQLEIFKKN